MTYTPIPRGTQNWDVPLNAALSQLDSNIASSSSTALQAANNLSDLTNAPQARINLGLTGLANALSNMTATTNPAVTSDNTQGYSLGSTWFNTTTNAMFVATSVATGAAVWLQIPPTFVDRTTSQSIAGVKTFTSTLQTTGSHDSIRAGATNSSLTTSVTGDAQVRLNVRADGLMEWGPGNAGRDTNLYRSAAGVLKTDTDLQAANLTPAAWVTYTPTWTSSGTAPAIGNGTLTGRYSISGNSVNVVVNMIAGSTTTFGTGGYSFALPFQAANQTVSYVGLAHLLDTTRWAGQVIVSPNAVTCGPFMSTSSTDPRLTSLSATTPQTLTTSAQIRLSYTYEMA